MPFKPNLKHLNAYFEELHEVSGLVSARVFTLANLLGNAAIWYIVYEINRTAKQDLMVLHYNVMFGINSIGSVKNLYLIPAIALVIVIINFLLLPAVNKKIQLIYFFLLIAPIICHLFVGMMIGTIYLNNF